LYYFYRRRPILEQIQIWLSNIGIQEDLSSILSQVFVLLLLLVGSWVLLLLVQQLVKRGLKNWIEKTDTIWDDIFYRSHFFNRLINLIPLILVYFTASWFPDLADWVERISLALIVMITTRSLEAAPTAINDIYDDYEVAKSRPIQGYMQVGKIILWFFAIILIISAILRSSPLLLLGGLGAFSAVLLLVFRDTLLGLFASVQFATNDMVRIGDWIEMNQYHADGEVFDITVNTVKVSNWDKTISTIPTHALMENFFKNWRGMGSQATGESSVPCICTSTPFDFVISHCWTG
jgi:miniconductance mechanosensitive channel